MDIRFPEPNKKPGVCYAVSDDGYELPVIDISHPAFATVPPADALEALRRRHARELKLRAYLPGFVRERLIRFLVKRSSLLQAAVANRPGFTRDPHARTFMSGTATYLMKLGAENLGSAWMLPMDARLARTYPPLALRLRLGEMARLLADGLARALMARPASSVELLNLGGGPAMDTLNALILLQKEQPALLRGRPVRIHVLDRDEAGPRFGARALAALLQGGALQGLEVSLSHVRYDWADVAPLEALVATLRGDALVAATSEGALFAYAAPDAVLANLAVLHRMAPPDFFITGDYAPDHAQNRLEQRETLLALELYSPDAFASLVARAGFRIAASSGAMPSCFRLERASS